MIIDYDFLSYVTFDQQLKITFRKSSGPPEKVHSPLKNSKSASPPFLLTLKVFQGPPAERGAGGHCAMSALIFVGPNPRHLRKFSFLRLTNNLGR